MFSVFLINFCCSGLPNLWLSLSVALEFDFHTSCFSVSVLSSIVVQLFEPSMKSTWALKYILVPLFFNCPAYLSIKIYLNSLKTVCVTVKFYLNMLRTVEIIQVYFS